MPEDARISKREAGYLYVGILGAKCANCIFFVALKNECLLVRGEIHPFYCCNGWSRASGASKNPLDFSPGSAFLPALRATESQELKKE